MTSVVSSPPEQQPTPPASARRTGRWIDDWEPENPAFWESTGKSVARRNLIWSIFGEHLGFSVWLLWSVSAALLTRAGFAFFICPPCKQPSERNQDDAAFPL